MGVLDSALITVAERLYYASHRRAHVAAWLVRVLGARAAGPWLLDFGGGDGAVAAKLVGPLATRAVIADIDETPLGRVPRTGSLRPVLVPPRVPLAFRASSFAGILLVDVLHHVPDREGTLRELVACLAPGGVIAIVEFEPHRLATRTFRAFARLGGRRCRFQVREILVGWLAEAGLRAEAETLDNLRYGVCARRPLAPG